MMGGKTITDNEVGEIIDTAQKEVIRKGLLGGDKVVPFDVVGEAIRITAEQTRFATTKIILEEIETHHHTSQGDIVIYHRDFEEFKKEHGID